MSKSLLLVPYSSNLPKTTSPQSNCMINENSQIVNSNFSTDLALNKSNMISTKGDNLFG